MTVVEVAEGLREAGAAADFRGRQKELLRHVGILDAVSERRTGMGGIALVDVSGRRPVTLPAGFLSGEIEILHPLPALRAGRDGHHRLRGRRADDRHLVLVLPSRN
ncbi:hypothetical protein OG349_08630 [Streptomyces sp. NBC_01317]|uniref:hypothetical protein n=1 Tax=Streptomyces sp. NBC_01317 TaxID=2903822 RepID=UPI002E1188A1|nr:hypothetical protein OG349_08630 [Streptomyces sp. NBC_01317]